MLLKIACFASEQSYSVQKSALKYFKSFSSYCSHSYRRIGIKATSTKDLPNEMKDTVLCDEASVENKKNKTEKAKTRLSMSDDVQNYLLSRPGGKKIISKLPKRVFRISRGFPEHIYLADECVAATIASTLQKYVLQEECVVLDANPGIGLLANCLIDVGVHSLHLYEPSSPLFNQLQTTKNIDSNKVDIFPDDFLSLWKMSFRDKFDNGTRVKDILSRYPKKNWEDDPTLKIISINQTSHFIKHLILSLTTQNGIMMHCRPELFIMMSPSLYAHLSASIADGYVFYRATSVIFQTFFSYNLLMKLPRKAFVPWFKYPSTNRKLKHEDSNEDILYLVRIVPKKDLYEKFFPPERLRQYWFFVRHHFRSRSRKLISEIEKWIPGCGVRLILEGYDIFTEMGELTPEEVYHIFVLFSSWPEYQDSSFLTSIETTSVKMEEATGFEYSKSKHPSDVSSNELEESNEIQEGT